MCAGNIEEDMKLLQSRELGDVERLAITLRLQEKRVAQVPRFILIDIRRVRLMLSANSIRGG